MGLTQSTQSSVNPPPATNSSRASTHRNPRPSGGGILSYFDFSSQPTHTHSHSSPTNRDIRLTSFYLVRAGLLPELIPRILDEARYWAGCSMKSRREIQVLARSKVAFVRGSGTWGSGPNEPPQLGECPGLRSRDGEIYYMASAPVGCEALLEPGEVIDGREENVPGSSAVADNGRVDTGRRRRAWARKVVVETVSHDQGWSNFNQYYGTYEQSYSWFEVALLRDGKEVEGSRYTVQYNVHAGQYFKHHSNTLGADHPTVKMAREGDRFVLWVRAKYPGWTNNIREGSLTVYTTPFPPQV
ncbi:hypothetical protein IAT38_001982 [Cryptococcus sp. DSM 104549]